ncbi:MAG: signal peptidase II [Roseiflexaceae bacterium]|nr:signal peptidase II [Roseiflexaceae bacterium]
MTDTRTTPWHELQRYWLRPAAIASVILAFDQATKAWALKTLGTVEGTTRPLIGDWLSLTLIHNTGIAFGMFDIGFSHFFTVTLIIISLGAMYFYRCHLPGPNFLSQACLGLIVGGAIGNIIDRVRFGYVIDFVHVHWFPGIFNVADSAITIGVTALALFLLLTGDGDRRRAASDESLLRDLLNQDPRRPGS